MTSIVLPVASMPVAPKRDVSGLLRRFRPRLALGYKDDLYRLGQRLETSSHEEGERELSAAVEAVDRRRSQYESLGLGSTSFPRSSGRPPFASSETSRSRDGHSRRTMRVCPCGRQGQRPRPILKRRRSPSAGPLPLRATPNSLSPVPAASSRHCGTVSPMLRRTHRAGSRFGNSSSCSR